ncbi:MAG TPA: class F sortase, partial [Micromonosporaceae bacterium]|nr:class F sortase [Micromonosporaceae bacterium]
MSSPPPPRRGRWTGPAAIGLVLAGVFATGAGLGQMGAGMSWGDLFHRPGKPPPREFPVLEPSRPTRIKIASLGVDASVHGVGIGADGTI